MNSISFKNLNFFKGQSLQGPQQKPHLPSPQKESKLNPFKKLVQSPFLFLIVFVAILSYFISYLPSKSLPQPQVGEIASSDIVAPMDLTIEDKETTEKRKLEAAEAVLPVYNLDQNVFLNIEEKIRGFFAEGRDWVKQPLTSKKIADFQKNCSDKYGIEISSTTLRTLAKLKFSPIIENNLVNLLGKILKQGIILSKNLFIHSEQEKGLDLIISPQNERHIKINEILDIEEGKQILSKEISQLNLNRSEKSVLTNLSNLFLSPNVTYNPLETEARKNEARNRVETVFYTIKKGKVIVRKGDEVSQEAIKQIQIINQNLQAKPTWLTNFLGTFLLFGLLLLTLWYYLKSLLELSQAKKNFLMMGITLILSLFFYKLSLFLAETFSQNSSLSLLAFIDSYKYAFPYQFGVLLFSFLTSNPVAIIFAVLNSLLVGYLFKANFYFMIFCLIGGFSAIYGLKYYGRQKRTTPFRAGLFVVAPINVFIIVTIHLIREKIGSWQLFTSELLMGVLGGVLSAALAFVFLPVFEHVFGFITQSKLLELTNSDLPIFKKMAIEAPGSYHHSLIVSSLAENAAKSINLDPMLVKAGALYHDIGKIKRPEYFIENRARSSDMHKALKPSMSTLVIINHVKEGLEQAKKLKLPKKIRDIIEQHHGTSLVRYFYQKAKEKYNPETQKIGEESYRYIGPKPQSKEAALIMLADSVEAASRSLKSPSKANFKRVITEIFNNYLQDGQLDDCDFSLRDLRKIADSFLASLDTIYQRRIEYPGFEFEVKKKKKQTKTKPNGPNNKSTT